MPRLTSREYLNQRQYLSALWDTNEGGSFAVLPGQQQRNLHDYYAPSEHISEQQALAHRTAMSKAFPSLPQSAGRAFNALRDHLKGSPNQIIDSNLKKRTSPGKIGGKQRTLRVLAISRPKIDHRRVARVLLNYAFDEFDSRLTEKQKDLLGEKTR